MLYELTIFNRGISKVWAAQVNNMPVAPTQYLAVSALDDNNKTAAVWCTQLGLGAREGLSMYNKLLSPKKAEKLL